MKAIQAVLAAGVGLLMAVGVLAQQGNRINVPLSDPSRPATVKGSLLNGGFTVTGYDGKEVIVEVHGGNGRPSGPREIDGLKRIDLGADGISITERDNIVQIQPQRGNANADVVLHVPYETSLNLNCVNGGGIVVDHVRGEIDVNNVNGKVTLKDVSGSVVAHALNEDLVVTFDQVAPDKPMSFSSLNGNIDVTLPPTTKARIKVKSQNGDVYTDFDIATERIGSSGGEGRPRQPGPVPGVAWHGD